MPTQSLTELMDLKGRVALVTGGAGHIGGVACEALLELGASIAVLDIDYDACKKRTADFHSKTPAAILPVACDLRDETETRRAVTTVINKMGGLDIIVHCAAYVGTTTAPGWAVPFEGQSVQAWDSALRVNLTSAFILAQESRATLARSDKGSIILFGSTYGVVGPDMRIYDGTNMANPAGYAASKGGVIQLARHLATLLAPNIRVNAITPGGVFRDQPESFVQEYTARTPLGRMAEENDLKGAVAYLASDMSAYVTGHNLVVDGGWTAW